MADSFPTPTTTPKRKRDEDDQPLSPIYTASKFSFQLPVDHTPKGSDVEDGSASPHSKVVHKFRGLALSGNSGGGGVAQQQNRAAAAAAAAPQGLYAHGAAYDPTRDEHKNGRGYGYSDDDPFASRKRLKVPELEMTDVEGNNTAVATASATADIPVVIPDPDVKSDPVATPKSKPVVKDAATTAGATVATSSQQLPYPSLDKLQDPKSRGRRRAGTPPLKGRKGTNKTNAAAAASAAGPQQQQEDQEMKTIVDPVRAALTWKEEEITIYDPEDDDDDGTGINGVGFMPTAAMAYARTQKRRLQLAEYKKREESEARARRSQRRRGSGAGLASKPSAGGSGGVRKVRFTESEASTVVTNV
ncbi:hypothetical protein BDP55DRAFT_194103 [Colletotrichum godetiae]|uniref:Uncharacterized protein n=1 Tax=Colletotrichum godetiae TaxID=1209918 RepID=A0AAJ0AK81_9PEZI|nr:uncharacterized protein BDP55DRAFT_194103 [Colletotrichum godetiae]KAK1673922.1 hypothetical protein BDP55DRAFT_194103 [Colletotrichum godetiae]